MVKIKLTQNKYALVDNEDFERVNKFKWYAVCMHGYWRAVRHITKDIGKRTLQCMHRLIMDCPEGMNIDHRNHNTLDNRKSNLRNCTKAENGMNQRPQQRKTSSQYKGVSWNKRDKIWSAYIKLNNKKIHLGSFLNEINAAMIYDKKAKELFGEYAYLNFKREQIDENIRV